VNVVVIRKVNGVIVEHTIDGVSQPISGSVNSGSLGLGRPGGKNSVSLAQTPSRKATAFEKVRNAAGATGRAIRAKARGEKVRVTDDEQERRLAICRSCPHFSGGTCDKCGCVARWKTRLATESCPIRKW
jgi:hypothetical protein